MNHINIEKAHRPYRWVHADAAARAAETDLGIAGETTATGKWALQEDNGNIYELTDTSPVTWVLRVPNSDTLTAAIDDVETLLAGYQPLDADLTAIAALTTTAFGRSLLTTANEAAARSAIGLGTISVLSPSGTGTTANFLRGDGAYTNILTGELYTQGLTMSGAASTSGTTSVDSPRITLNGTYWNSGTSKQVTALISIDAFTRDNNALRITIDEEDGGGGLGLRGGNAYSYTLEINGNQTPGGYTTAFIPPRTDQGAWIFTDSFSKVNASNYDGSLNIGRKLLIGTNGHGISLMKADGSTPIHTLYNDSNDDLFVVCASNTHLTANLVSVEADMAMQSGKLFVPSSTGISFTDTGFNKGAIVPTAGTTSAIIDLVSPSSGYWRASGSNYDNPGFSISRDADNGYNCLGLNIGTSDYRTTDGNYYAYGIYNLLNKYSNFAGSNNASTWAAFNHLKGGSSATNYTGFQGACINQNEIHTGSGTWNYLVGTLSTSEIYGGSANITNLVGVYIGNNVYPATYTGTITNNIGILIGNIAEGTNKWAIKTGTGYVEFGDNVQVERLKLNQDGNTTTTAVHSLSQVNSGINFVNTSGIGAVDIVSLGTIGARFRQGAIFLNSAFLPFSDTNYLFGNYNDGSRQLSFKVNDDGTTTFRSYDESNVTKDVIFSSNLRTTKLKLTTEGDGTTTAIHHVDDSNSGIAFRPTYGLTDFYSNGNLVFSTRDSGLFVYTNFIPGGSGGFNFTNENDANRALNIDIANDGSTTLRSKDESNVTQPIYSTSPVHVSGILKSTHLKVTNEGSTSVTAIHHNDDPTSGINFRTDLGIVDFIAGGYLIAGVRQYGFYVYNRFIDGAGSGYQFGNYSDSAHQFTFVTDTSGVTTIRSKDASNATQKIVSTSPLEVNSTVTATGGFTLGSGAGWAFDVTSAGALTAKNAVIANIADGDVPLSVNATAGHTADAFRLRKSGVDKVTWDANFDQETVGNITSEKVISAKTFKEGVTSITTGTTYTVNLTDGAVHRVTSSGNLTVTLPNAADIAGQSFTLVVKYGGTHTLTFAGGTGLLWADGAAPTATSVNNKTDLYSFFSDGSVLYGRDGGRNF